MSEEKGKRINVPEYKKRLVEELADKFKNSRTVLLASIKNLPDSQLQAIKKKLRGKAELKIAKKTALMRAIGMAEKGGLIKLKEKIESSVVILFSDIDAFELSGFLTENKSPAKAKAGDIAPEDINVEAGPTELVPGPAISELSSVGLKVIVENGKLSVRQGMTVAKKGKEIDSKLAGVLSKLNIEPMRVGLEPIAAYDAIADKTYFGIKIDKEGTLNSLRESISKAFGFAVNLKIITKETVSYLIKKAGLEEKAIENIFNNKNAKEGQ